MEGGVKLAGGKAVGTPLICHWSVKYRSRSPVQGAC